LPFDAEERIAMKTDENWEVVDEINGDLQAEILRGMLEAQDIQVWLSQEGAGKAMGLTIPIFGKVSIMVPSHQAERARAILDDYYSGDLEQVEMDPDAVHKIEQEVQAEEDDEDLA
jgi:hypothetical protein